MSCTFHNLRINFIKLIWDLAGPGLELQTNEVKTDLRFVHGPLDLTAIVSGFLYGNLCEIIFVFIF